MFGAILTIFIIMAFGFITRHAKILKDGDYKVMNNFIYYAALPALIFISLYDNGTSAFSDWTLITANAAAILVMIALVLLVSALIKLPRKLIAVFLLAAFYGNILYMGYQVNVLEFGEVSAPIVVMVVTVYNLIIFSLGLALLQAYSDGLNTPDIVKRISTNPLLLSSAIGLIYIYAGLPALPASLAEAIRLVGHVTSPVAIFAMGVFMYGRNPFAQLKLNLAISATKMFFFPLLFVAIARAFSLTGLGYEVSLFEAAMPLAVSNFVLADHYKLDTELVSSAIVLTTLLSLISLPILSSL
ncbi:MAG: AEC family transporter [Candidatus Burarchaeum sp.]|nr:AEC family transporter [Candidatus Burarchaeum sp.]MDO8339960.1 AEC family transporter [Candidatus Burarchaeum sp.]